MPRVAAQAERPQPTPCRVLGSSALTLPLPCPMTGAGSDGVEEIKRHPFFVTIDWNVSGCCGPHCTQGQGGGWGTSAQYRPEVSVNLSPGQGAFPIRLALHGQRPPALGLKSVSCQGQSRAPQPARAPGALGGRGAGQGCAACPGLGPLGTPGSASPASKGPHCAPVEGVKDVTQAVKYKVICDTC